MCWAEWINPGVVDQDIDMAISELDRLSGDFTRARGISQVRRNEIGFSSRRPNLRNCFFPAFGVTTDNDDMDAKLSQFIGCGTANPAGSSCNKCC